MLSDCLPRGGRLQTLPVLILVLLDDALRLSVEPLNKGVRLNPCSAG